MVERVVQRLSEHLRQPYDLSGRDLLDHDSIGVAGGSAAHGSPDDILRHADRAMYTAKASGRGIYRAPDIAGT